MALRFLALKMTKALLPLRAPAAGSRAFATAPKPKGHPSTELDPAKFNSYSYEEIVETVLPQLQEQLRLSLEEKKRTNKLLLRIVALIAVGGPGSILYVASTAGPKTA